MRTTLTIDDELLKKAHELTGIEDRSTLIHEGLRALIQRTAAWRLSKLRGIDPKIQDIPRRRPSAS